MFRKILLAIPLILLAITDNRLANAGSHFSDVQVTIPVRFLTVQGDFFERIGTDFDFPTVTDFFETNSGFGGGIGGGILFPDVIGNADVSVEARVIASRFSADQIRTQNGTVVPTDGDITDVGVGINLGLLIEMFPPRIDASPLDFRNLNFKLSAGGGVLRRNVDLSINGVPLVDDSGTVPFVEFGAGVQFPLNNVGRRGQTALYVGVNHRITGGMDLRTLPFITGIPFGFNRTSTTSVRMDLIIFIKPRITIQDE